MHLRHGTEQPQQCVPVITLTAHPLTPVPSPPSTPAGELASSLAASIATLSTAVATLAKERRTSTLMATISAVSGTITSLAAVVATLAQPDATATETKHDAPVIPLEEDPQQKQEHPTAANEADAQIVALKTALSAVERESKMRLHHQRVTLLAKHRRSVEHTKRRLDEKDRLIVDIENRLELAEEDALEGVEMGAKLLAEAEDNEDRLVSENRHLTVKNTCLAEEKARLVTQVQRLKDENARLLDENKRFVAGNSESAK